MRRRTGTRSEPAPPTPVGSRTWAAACGAGAATPRPARRRDHDPPGEPGAGRHRHLDVGQRRRRPHVRRSASDGTLWCWGTNSLGQVRNGDDRGPARPGPGRHRQLEGRLGRRPAHVRHPQRQHPVVLGLQRRGQLGDGTTDDRTSPVQLEGTRGRRSLAGGLHTCAINGATRCGLRATTSLASSARHDRGRDVPDRDPRRTWPRIIAGGLHTAAPRATTPSGAGATTRPASWATGRPPTRLAPSRSGRYLEDCEPGPDYSCATRTAGSPWCWGDNLSGQLGDGTSTNRQSPTRSVASRAGPPSTPEGPTCACHERLRYGPTEGRVADGSDRRSSVSVAQLWLCEGRMNPMRPWASSSEPALKSSAFRAPVIPLPKRRPHSPSMTIGWPSPSRRVPSECARVRWSKAWMRPSPKLPTSRSPANGPKRPGADGHAPRRVQRAAAGEPHRCTCRRSRTRR